MLGLFTTGYWLNEGLLNCRNCYSLLKVSFRQGAWEGPWLLRRQWGTWWWRWRWCSRRLPVSWGMQGGGLDCQPLHWETKLHLQEEGKPLTRNTSSTSCSLLKLNPVKLLQFFPWTEMRKMQKNEKKRFILWIVYFKIFLGPNKSLVF